MLQIRLSKPATDVGGSSKSAPSESVTVACPDHLVLADLPVAKSLGTPFANAAVKNVGQRSRRQLGERVHFCVQCDFPIAIYGRLSPCEHAFCLDCARSDSVCYLCDERIQKIQTIKMMEGLFICAAPNCFKSFLKKSEFEYHINESHADLLHIGKEKEGNESEVTSARKLDAIQGPARSVFSPTSNSQQTRSSVLSKPLQLFSAQLPNHPYEQHPGGCFSQQSFGPGGGLQSDSVNQNPSAPTTQYGYGVYSSDGTQQYYARAPYELARPESAPEAGLGQGSLSSFPPGPPVHSMNVVQNYPQPWNAGPASLGLEAPSQSTANGFMNADPQGRGFFHSDYPQNMGPRQGGRPVDPRDGKRALVPRQPPASLPPSYSVQPQRGRQYTIDGSHDAPPPGFGWQSERLE